MARTSPRCFSKSLRYGSSSSSEILHSVCSCHERSGNRVCNTSGWGRSLCISIMFLLGRALSVKDCPAPFFSDIYKQRCCQAIEGVIIAASHRGSTIIFAHYPNRDCRRMSIFSSRRAFRVGRLAGRLVKSAAKWALIAAKSSFFMEIGRRRATPR